MMLTTEFKDTVKERAQRDLEFREALLKETLALLRAGDLEVAEAILRDYLNATER
jgi:hypothetical protein